MSQVIVDSVSAIAIWRTYEVFEAPTEESQMTTGTEIPSAEIVIERLRIALAELGWDGLTLNPAGQSPGGWPHVKVTWHRGEEFPHLAIIWTAGNIVLPKIACWACWSSDDVSIAWRCFDGHCQHPEGPARPPRKLLKGRFDA